MARQLHQTVVSPPELKITLFKKQILGRGAYGVVCRAKYGELPCAAKLIQAIFFEDNDPAAQTMVDKFREECQRMSVLKHPNIIQYLESYVDPDTGLPALLMEEMDESLTTLLARSAPALPLKTHVSICTDVTLALSYLHACGIIHRDLSSNNVLLVSADRRAKVTDFGMSKLARSPAQTRQLTQCPGCLVYMPPEALREAPRYSFKLDVFSFGVLIIQMLTRNFPNPGPTMKTVSVEVGSPMFPTGGIVHVTIPEAERRKADIDAIVGAHPLKELALPCLRDEEGSRPNIQELCKQLVDLKQQVVGEGSRPTEVCSQQDLEELNKQLSEQLQRAEDTLRTKEERIRALEGKLVAIERAQPPENTRIRSETQVDTLVREKQELERQLREANELVRQHTSANRSLLGQSNTPQFPNDGATTPSLNRGSLLQVKSILKQRSPELGLGKGVVATDGKKCYFTTNGNSVYSYSIQADKWEHLPDYPCMSPGLTIVKDRLTGLGGVTKTGGPHQASNSLYSLVDGIWVEMFPSMPTKQYSPTSVCSKSLLVVAGGITLRSPSVTTLDLMNTITYRWSSVPSPLGSLPRSLWEVSMALSESTGRLYIAGGSGMFECSLWALQSTPPNVQFKAVPDPPVKWGSIATIKGQLVSLGGFSGDKHVSSIHVYITEKDVWHPIGELVSPRFLPTAVPISSESLLVVSGSNMTVQDAEVVSCVSR